MPPCTPLHLAPARVRESKQFLLEAEVLEVLAALAAELTAQAPEVL